MEVWAEPAGWRSVSRPRPSMPYSLLATHYQLLKITSRQVARSSPSPGRDLGFFFFCIIVDIVVDIALWWSWNCPRTTRRSLHLQRLRLLKMCFFFFSYITLTIPPRTLRLLYLCAFPGGARTNNIAKTRTMCVRSVARVKSMRGEVPRRHI